MPTIINTGSKYMPKRAPRIDAIALRRLLWEKFGKICFVRQSGYRITVLLKDSRYVGEVANATVRYDETLDVPDRQNIHIISLKSS